MFNRASRTAFKFGLYQSEKRRDLFTKPKISPLGFNVLTLYSEAFVTIFDLFEQTFVDKALIWKGLGAVFRGYSAVSCCLYFTKMGGFKKVNFTIIMAIIKENVFLQLAKKRLNLSQFPNFIESENP